MAKILIVDDSSLGRKLLNRILIKLGHEVVAEAQNGEEGIREYNRLKPDIVAMDVDMPGIDGLETSKRILKDHPEARIIIVSAHEKNDLIVEMQKYGLKHYIIKPVTEENVSSAFKNALRVEKVSQAKTVDVKTAEVKAAEEKAVAEKTPGIEVTAFHHAVVNPFTVVKTREEGKVLSLEIDKETRFSFNDEDPIVLGYESNGGHIFLQCEVSNADTASRSIKTVIIGSFTYDDEIAFQNVPVSMYVDVRLISTRRRYPAIIKTFMLNELVFKSTADMIKNDKISFDIFHKNKVLAIEGTIISKVQGRNINEYILKLDFDDYNIKKTHIAFLKDLARSMNAAIKGART